MGCPCYASSKAEKSEHDAWFFTDSGVRAKQPTRELGTSVLPQTTFVILDKLLQFIGFHLFMKNCIIKLF